MASSYLDERGGDCFSNPDCYVCDDPNCESECSPGEGPGAGGSYLNPGMSEPDIYWSISSDDTNEFMRWAVDFRFGEIVIADQTAEFLVRCVERSN